MALLLSLVPLAIATVLATALHRLNRRRAWFRLGELLFWDVVLLVLVELLWLRWF